MIPNFWKCLSGVRFNWTREYVQERGSISGKKYTDCHMVSDRCGLDLYIRKAPVMRCFGYLYRRGGRIGSPHSWIEINRDYFEANYRGKLSRLPRKKKCDRENLVLDVRSLEPDGSGVYIITPSENMRGITSPQCRMPIDLWLHSTPNDFLL